MLQACNKMFTYSKVPLYDYFYGAISLLATWFGPFRIQMTLQRKSNLGVCTEHYIIMYGIFKWYHLSYDSEGSGLTVGLFINTGNLTSSIVELVVDCIKKNSNTTRDNTFIVLGPMDQMTQIIKWTNHIRLLNFV